MATESHYIYMRVLIDYKQHRKSFVEENYTLSRECVNRTGSFFQTKGFLKKKGRGSICR